MNRQLFDAFVGRHFDPVFVLTAATSNARDTVLFDVPELHAVARQAIRDVVEQAGMDGADPTLRSLLIQAPAGYGKTHRLTTTLLQLAKEGKVYPAVMQLSAKVSIDELSKWMLRKLFDELAASHFRDASGRTPLQQLARRLWARATPDERVRFEQALEADKMDLVRQVVMDAVPGIRRSSAGLQRADDPMLRMLLLKAEDALPAIDVWIRGGPLTDTAAGLELPMLESESDFQSVIIGIARIAMASGAPLVIGIDQIEAIARIADERLLTAVIATALQLVENSPVGLGVVIAALLDTYATQVRDQIDASFRQRIEMGRVPVELEYVDHDVLRKIVDRRVQLLLQRAGVGQWSAEDVRTILPDWVLDGAESNNLRQVLQVIREYRRDCQSCDRFIEPHQFGAGDGGTPAGPTIDDFDKLWADASDADLGQEQRYSAYDKEQLLIWLLSRIPLEVPEIDSVHAESRVLADAAKTTVIDVEFRAYGDRVVERWAVAFADAPNRLEQFSAQIRAVTEASNHARPALLRSGRVQGIGDDGNPDRTIEQLRRLQAGNALLELLAAGGRIVTMAMGDWQRADLARRFCGERAQAYGFGDWCRQRRFLLEHSGIGQIARLLVPSNLSVWSGRVRSEDDTTPVLRPIVRAGPILEPVRIPVASAGDGSPQEEVEDQSDEDAAVPVDGDPSDAVTRPGSISNAADAGAEPREARSWLSSLLSRNRRS